MVCSLNKRVLLGTCIGCSSLTASLPLVLKHFVPALSDAAQGLVMGVPLGLALTGLILYLKMSRPDEA